jgi:hypothetical protein
MMRNLLGVVVSLAAFAAPVSGEALHSVKSGNWSDATVWNAGRLPAGGDAITISTGHAVTFQVSSPNVTGVTIESGATLTFDPNVSATLHSTGSVIVRGTLAMKPASLATVHRIAFENVNEASFVGGGLEVVPGDVGLWVRDGQLDLQGTPKTAWTRLAGGIASGASTIALEAAPVNWSPGDDISIVPTEPPSVGDRSWDGFDLRALVSISGASVTLQSGTSRAHPMVNGLWRAEVLNLTRNVRIEGSGNGSASPTANHRAHIWIRSDKPQIISHVAIRYMGPRQVGEDNPTESILGRYALHFHHSMDGSRGSTVKGTVIRDAGSHAFATHMSHGVTIQDAISYNTWDEAYWWDPGDESHDIVYDRSVAAIVRVDPEYRGYGLTAFSINQGLRNVIRDSVAVGVQGNVDASGFNWPEGDAPNGNGVWNFSKGNIAHNNKVDGIFAWQNDVQPHVIADYLAYHNGEAGIDHGAYGNGYHYENSVLYGNGETALHLKAVSPGPNEETSAIVHLRFDNMLLDGGGQGPDLILSDDHNADGTEYATFIRNSIFRNATNAVHFREGERGDWLDIELCAISTTFDVKFDANALPDNRVRLQCDGQQAFDITKTGRTAIAPFAGAYPDESKPQVSIASPSGGSVVTGVVNVQSYTYDLGGMQALELYVDNGLVASSTTAPFTLSWNSAAAPNGRHDLQILGVDTAGLRNVSARTTVFTSNAGAPLAPTPGYSLWSTSAQPAAHNPRNTQAVEVGVKFKSDVAGTVSAIRFYRNSTSTSGYTVHLWSSTGTLLATGQGNDGPSTPGWTEIPLTTPVAIAANTIYVASYFSPTGQASGDEDYFDSTGVNSGWLHAPSGPAVQGNGVFTYCSSGCFPSETDDNTNDWVDVVFRP